MRKRSLFRDVLEYLLIRLLLVPLECLPLSLAEWLARVYVAAILQLVPKWRKTALRNLELVFPEMPPARREAIAKGSFRSLARVLLALAKLPRITRANLGHWVRFEGYEHFHEAKALGRGVLFATAHLGNWELSAHAHALHCEPMHVVVRPLDNPLLDRFLQRRRSFSGNQVLSKKDFARGILKALASNEAVGILADQNTLADQGIFVEFFGIPACTNPSLARLAAHTGAPVIPGFALWSESEKRYVLRLYPPIQITGDVYEDTRRIQRVIEETIRSDPEQWLWMHRRWKTRPPGQPPLY